MYSMPRSIIAATRLIALLALVGASAASAKPAKSIEKVDPPKTSVMVNAIEVVRPERTECRKVRRRLWIEQQGWVVRQISSCS
jgi:hypothetical protein